MIKFKNFFKVCLASSLLLACVEQKLQQVAVSSPQTNIGGGQVNGNQVNINGNTGNIDSGDKSQINVGGNASVTINKPAPIIDSFNLLDVKSTYEKPGYTLKFNGISETAEPQIINKLSYNSIKSLKILIKGKNFDQKDLKVSVEFDYEISFSGNNKFKIEFDIIEKSDTQIIAKFPIKYEFPLPSSEFLENKYKSYNPPNPTPAPGENAQIIPKSYPPLLKCLDPVPTITWSSNWLSVETASGKSIYGSNPPQVTFLPEGMSYEDYQIECSLFEELSGKVRVVEVIEIYTLTEDGKKKFLPFPKYIPTSTK